MHFKKRKLGTFCPLRIEKKWFIKTVIYYYYYLQLCIKKKYLNNMQWWIVQIKKVYLLRE